MVFDHALEEEELLGGSPVQHSPREEGDFDMEEVQPRIQPPRIPRMFVPKSGPTGSRDISGDKK